MIRFGFVMPLAAWIACSVTPNDAAILPSWSPDRTTYTAGVPAGAEDTFGGGEVDAGALGVGDSLALEPGVAMDPADGEGEAAAVPPSGSGMRSGRSIPIPKPPAPTTTRISRPTRTDATGDRRRGRAAASSGTGRTVG
jgi:hypothetical protein